jgi:hypothetical protein
MRQVILKYSIKMLCLNVELAKQSSKAFYNIEKNALQECSADRTMKGGNALT